MKAIQWIGVAALAAMIAGCNGGSGDTAGTTGAANATTGGKSASGGGKPFRIVMIAKSNDNPVFQSAKAGAESAAKEQSGKVGREIQIDWQTPPTEDAQVQAQRISEAANTGADAILVSCSDAAKLKTAIDEAVGRNIPVMTFDSDAPDSKRFAFYGVDDLKTGARIMDELAKLNGGKGNVAILAGNQTAPNLQKRVKGVQDAAKKYPGIKIVSVFYHKETPEDAAAKVLEAMKSNPQIDSWAMVGGWPLFTKTLLTDLDPNKVKIVSVDALPVELPYVEKGIAPLLLAQPTFLWGKVSVEKIVDKVINKKDVPVINEMELVPVTKESLGKWAQQLKDWGFQDVDPKYLTGSK